MVRTAAVFLLAFMAEEQHRNLLLISSRFPSVVGSTVVQFDGLMTSKIAVLGIPALSIFLREKGRNWHFKLANRVW